MTDELLHRARAFSPNASMSADGTIDCMEIQTSRAPPDDTYRNSDFNISAFTGCLSWALGHDDIMQHYRTATGDQYRAPASPIESEIDRATGADRAFLVRFAEWVGLNVWGEAEDVPDMDLIFR